MASLLPERRERLPLRPVAEDEIPVLSREQFLEKFADEYRPGQHVTFAGPTQRGKTTLSLEMLNAVIDHDKRPWCVVFAGKPPSRDPVMGRAAKRLNLRIVKEWPPGPIDKLRFNVNKERGYVLRPEHVMSDPDKTDRIMRDHFRAALIDCYKSKKPVIVVVDEGVHVSTELKLRKYMDTILMRGAPVVALWTLVQRGRYMSYMIYDQPEWFLLGYDPDVANQRRYSDIGGVDPKTIMRLQTELATVPVATGGTISQFLCIRRSGPEIFIIDVQ